MTLGGVRPFGQEVAVLTIYRRRCYFQVTHELLSGWVLPRRTAHNDVVTQYSDRAVAK